MSRSELIRALKDPNLESDDPLAPMGLKDEKLRSASNTNQLTTAWFCTLYSAMSRCCQ